MIDGVLEVDVEGAHRALDKGLAIPGTPTASQVLDALNGVEQSYLLAVRLKNKARRDYEVFKEDHEAWMEERRTAVLAELEREKAEKELKKQITEKMIVDKVRATWPTEYANRVAEQKDVQAAVHTLEELAEAWKSRAKTLSSMAQITTAMGAVRR